jgi:hypothetical protein
VTTLENYREIDIARYHLIEDFTVLFLKESLLLENLIHLPERVISFDESECLVSGFKSDDATKEGLSLNYKYINLPKTKECTRPLLKLNSQLITSKYTCSFNSFEEKYFKTYGNFLFIL